jgi:voltage-gated potassium channel
MILVQQVCLAVLLVLLTVSLLCAGVGALIIWLRSVPATDIHELRIFHSAGLVMRTSVAVILLHGLIILLWASCYRWLCFPAWESAFYFSASTYATVGYGDIILSSKWRLLGPLEAMVGMLMSGVTIGLLFATMSRLVEGESQSRLPVSPEPVVVDQ